MTISTNKQGQEVKFQVINKFSGTIVGTYKTKHNARCARDKADLKYGSYAHLVTEIIVEKE